MNILYRFYNSLGQLLYVGITNNPTVRFRDHKNSREWWPVVVMITMERFGSRDQLIYAERRAIATEDPLHNIAHNRLSPDRIEGVDPKADGQCPGCGKDVIYSRAFNLIFHVDGTDNLACRVKILRGVVEYTGRIDR